MKCKWCSRELTRSGATRKGECYSDARGHCSPPDDTKACGAVSAGHKACDRSFGHEGPHSRKGEDLWGNGYGEVVTYDNGPLSEIETLLHGALKGWGSPR